MTPVKVDFIVPALNAEKTIRCCVESIRHQICENVVYQIYVVDNGCEDQTVQNILDLPVKILHCPNRGRSLARNYGLRHSTSEWVAFIDSDVELSPTWLTEILKYTSIASVGAIQGPIISHGEHDLDAYRFRKKYHATVGKFIENENPSLELPIMNTAACMFSRRALEHIKGFDERLERSEDYDLSLRLMIRGYSFFATEKATASVYFVGSWSDYLSRTFWASYHNAYYAYHYLEYTRSSILLGSIELSPGLHLYSAMDKWMKFFGAVGFLFIAGRGKKLLDKKMRPAKFNLVLPRLNFEGAHYRFSTAVRFYLSDSSLCLYGLKGGRSYRTQESGLIKFFRLYLDEKLINQNLSEHEQSIRLFITERILVQE